ATARPTALAPSACSGPMTILAPSATASCARATAVPVSVPTGSTRRSIWAPWASLAAMRAALPSERASHSRLASPVPPGTSSATVTGCEGSTAGPREGPLAVPWPPGSQAASVNAARPATANRARCRARATSPASPGAAGRRLGIAERRGRARGMMIVPVCKGGNSCPKRIQIESRTQMSGTRVMRQGEGTGKALPMQAAAEPLAARIEAPALPAGLYLVATPIGAARDITLRALDVLNGAGMLAAEDTRRLRQLLALHGIPLRGRRLLAHHDHNEAASSPALVAAIAAGASVAYASDAGTPLVSDPGYRLAAAVREAGLEVHALPGPSAVLAALMVAGLPSDAFVFAGFPPATAAARRKWLARWDGVEATVILFESPRRVKETLRDLCENHPERRIVICRELTKRFEERLAGSARELLDLVPEEG